MESAQMQARHCGHCCRSFVCSISFPEPSCLAQISAVNCMLAGNCNHFCCQRSRSLLACSLLTLGSHWSTEFYASQRFSVKKS